MGEFLNNAAPQIAQTGGDILSTVFNRMFAASDYRKQRRDALADWNMQNAYNSPQQQMQRLKEAGLNPNFVYGQGAVANSTQSPRASSINPTHADFKVINPMDTMLRYQNIEQNKVQTNNLRADYENKLAQNRLIDANVMKTLVDVDKGSYDLAKKQFDRSNGLWEIAAETAKQGLLNKQIQGNYMISRDSREEMENVRREQKNKADVDLLVSRLGQIKTQNAFTDAQKKNVDERTNHLKILIQNENLNQSQKQALADIMMDNALIDNIIKGKKVTTEVEDQVIRMFKIKAMKAGVSTEYAEKMALSMLSLLK